MTAPARIALLSVAAALVTMALKFGAWWLTGSVSLWSDAVESLVNLVASVTALSALAIAGRPADADHAYGHEKAEYFASGVEGALIVIAAVAIMASALARLLSPQPPDDLPAGIAIAIAAAAINFATAQVMLRAARRHDSIALEADARHLLADVTTTGAIVAGLVVVLVAPQWSVLDPLMAIAVGLHIVYTGVRLLRRSIGGLMDAALPAAEIEAVEQAIRTELPAGTSFHALRTRKSGASRFIDFHLLVPPGETVEVAHALCDRIEAAIAGRLARAEVTIHVEPAPGSSADSQRRTSATLLNR